MTDTRNKIALLAAALHAYDKTFGLNELLIECPACGATWYGTDTESCDWCLQARLSRAEYILRPPAPRGYGYATKGDRCRRHDRWWTDDNPAKRCCDGPFEPFDDLAALGYDPAQDRRRDLEHWRHDMQTAADAGYITEDEGNHAWRSATNNPSSSTSSTGTNSTPTKTTTTRRSFPASPSAAAGQRSTPRRKPENRRS